MNSKALGSAACAVLAVLLSVAAPFVVSDYNLRVLVLALQAAIAVIGLAIAFGWAGLIQLGQAAFIGVGAYTSALLAAKAGWSFWLAMPMGLLAAALLALVLAVPLLRLRGHYLALATVGLNVSVEVVMKNWTPVTGGYDGISGIPGVVLFGQVIDTDRGAYFLALAFLTAVALFALALRRSRFGRAMLAVRDDEIAAAAAGVPVVRTQVLAFVIASVLAALSGSLYAHYAHFIAPGDFDLARSVTLLVMLIAGGEVSIAGSIAGALVLSFAPEWLRVVGDAYLAVFGVAVLLILVLMPQGIAGQLRRLLALSTARSTARINAGKAAREAAREAALHG